MFKKTILVLSFLFVIALLNNKSYAQYGGSITITNISNNQVFYDCSNPAWKAVYFSTQAPSGGWHVKWWAERYFVCWDGTWYDYENAQGKSLAFGNHTVQMKYSSYDILGREYSVYSSVVNFSITMSPLSASISRNGGIFTCTPSGCGPYQYQWQFYHESFWINFGGQSYICYGYPPDATRARCIVRDKFNQVVAAELAL